jgi:hypothetical protein
VENNTLPVSEKLQTIPSGRESQKGPNQASEKVDAEKSNTIPDDEEKQEISRSGGIITFFILLIVFLQYI